MLSLNCAVGVCYVCNLSCVATFLILVGFSLQLVTKNSNQTPQTGPFLSGRTDEAAC